MAGTDIRRGAFPWLSGKRQTLRTEARRVSGAQSRRLPRLQRTDLHGLSVLHR